MFGWKTSPRLWVLIPSNYKIWGWVFLSSDRENDAEQYIGNDLNILIWELKALYFFVCFSIDSCANRLLWVVRVNEMDWWLKSESGVMESQSSITLMHLVGYLNIVYKWNIILISCLVGSKIVWSGMVFMVNNQNILENREIKREETNKKV